MGCLNFTDIGPDFFVFCWNRKVKWKVKLRPTWGGRLLLIGGGKEFPSPNPYEMEVRNVQNGPYDGGKRFPGGNIFTRKSFLGEDFYYCTSRKSLPGERIYWAEYPYSYTGRPTRHLNPAEVVQDLQLQGDVNHPLDRGLVHLRWTGKFKIWVEMSRTSLTWKFVKPGQKSILHAVMLKQ